MLQFTHFLTKLSILTIVVIGVVFEPCDAKYSTYVGADLGQTFYYYKTGYGKKVMPRNPYMLNFYLGHNIADMVGIEAGYEWQVVKRRENTRLESYELWPGNATVGDYTGRGDGSWVVVNSRSSTQHPYIGITGDYPVASETKFIGLLGLSASNFKAVYSVIDDDLAGLPAVADINDSIRTFSKTKIIPMLRLGVLHSLTNRCRLAGNFTWHNISQLKAKPKENPNALTQLRMKNGYNFSIGINYLIL